jgi:serine/threonine protein kinase/Tol biopolymer transport system component
MTLPAGTRLAAYEIVAPLGAGGMGEVYRARDASLGRDVAIKVLPEAFAQDAERLARFEREAKTLASLNHPNIAHVYGLEQADGVRGLVMELVEGPTLADRIVQGAVPLDEALPIAKQIAEALEAAHEQGIIHRDLKPANVKVRSDGTVKVLDFGLAKALGPADGGQTTPTSSPLAMTHSPTLTTPIGVTGVGVILGTAAYMAPEQAKGRPVSRASDIWAFGCVLYEMLTGRAVFTGDDVTEVLAAVVRAEPDWNPLPAPTPREVRSLLRHCLDKDQRRRWQDAASVRIGIEEALSARVDLVAEAPHPASGSERVFWLAGLVASIVISIVATLLWTGRQSPESRPIRDEVTRFAMFPGDDVSISSRFDMPLALSPDGRHIVWVGVSGNGTRQLWLRSWASERAQVIAGTEGARSPFWSADSEWIGFVADNNLKKVRPSSGTPQTIASGVPSLSVGGATWNTSGVILLSISDSISRVSAQGGVLEQATTPHPASGQGGHLWPRFLSDGNHFIYSGVNPTGIYLGALDGAEPRILQPLRAASALEYVPGFIVYVVPDGGLFARPFDDEELRFVGDPVRIVDGIPLSGPGMAPFSMSATGTLAYWPYAPGTAAVLRWFDRDGRFTPAVDVPARYAGFALSPDARRLAFAKFDAKGRSDIWVRDLARGTDSPLTSDGYNFTPAWSPDGTRIAYSAARLRPPDLFVRNLADNSDILVSVTAPPDFPLTWVDGASIVSVITESTSGTDLRISRLADGKEAAGSALPLNTRFNETQARLSRDTRWIAYTTDESGHEEVWVATFPSGENRRQVSVAGGTAPEWGADSAEIFYVSREKQMMATSFKAGEVGTPRALFRIDNLIDPEDRGIFPGSYPYAVANGQRFLAAISTRDPDAPPINIILNWPALLKR